MHDFPTFEWLRLVGSSPDALRALYGYVAVLGLLVLLGVLFYLIAMTTFEIYMERLALRDRALDRIRGVVG